MRLRTEARRPGSAAVKDWEPCPTQSYACLSPSTSGDCLDEKRSGEHPHHRRVVVLLDKGRGASSASPAPALDQGSVRRVEEGGRYSEGVTGVEGWRGDRGVERESEREGGGIRGEEVELLIRCKGLGAQNLRVRLEISRTPD